MIATRKITEAQYMECNQCGMWWSMFDPVPWPLTASRAMHKRGCPTHTLTLYRHEWECEVCHDKGYLHLASDHSRVPCHGCQS